MTDPLVERLSDAQTLALTMWGEARARLVPHVGFVTNPPQAWVDVANVVVNRVHDPRWSKLGVKGTCLARHQFSCWWPVPGKPGNYEMVLDRAQQMVRGVISRTLVNCLLIAHSACNDVFEDHLRRATHYHATWLVPPPAWAAPPAVLTAERFGHRFYANVR